MEGNTFFVVHVLQELREQKRKEYEHIAVFPCRLRVLPNCIFNTRDPIVVGVVIEDGVVKPGTPLTVPSKSVSELLLAHGSLNNRAVCLSTLEKYKSGEVEGSIGHARVHKNGWLE